MDESHLGNPRRVTVGLEQNRLAMLLAVLHRHGGLLTYNYDVFVNVVGGVRVMETAADLALLLSVRSSLRDSPLPHDLIVFGGGIGQPPTNEELHSLCQDVIDVAKKYSSKFIYTLGGFHTNRKVNNSPKTFVTTTSFQLTNQLEKLNVYFTPQKSVITGFNSLILT